MNIDAAAVTVVIDGHQIIQDESLSCQPDAITALVGPSGCGKTTLLHCLGLLQQPTSGRILVDGTDTTNWNPGKRRKFWRDHAAFVLQDYGIMDEESVAFNVVMAASVLGRRPRGDGKRLGDALDQTGLAGRSEERAAHLSGGEKQRLAVARAIYKRASVILVDEPTASLDDANRDRVIDLFVRRAQEGCAVIVATHDPAFIEACHVLHQIGPAKATLTAH